MQTWQDRRWRQGLLLAVVLGLGCATGPPLTPAVGTTTVTGTPAAAVGTSDGVRVIADADAWRAVPRDIGVAIPMRVRIENKSGHPLLIRYNDFTLDAAGGMQLTAVRPLDVKGRAWVYGPDVYPGPYSGGSFYMSGPPLYHSGFYVAPGYSRYYPGMSPWSGAWGWDAWGWDAPSWPVELPTQDMLVQAIPEGVLKDGGVVDGFIYFPVLKNASKDQQVNFHYNMVDATSGQPIGDVTIAFAAR